MPGSCLTQEVVRLRKSSALLCLHVEEWCRARILHPIYSCPLDGHVKWQSWEQDWEQLVHPCLVTLLSTSRKREGKTCQCSSTANQPIWYSVLDDPSGFLTLKPLNSKLPSYSQQYKKYKRQLFYRVTNLFVKFHGRIHIGNTLY